jgi:hypothetical protein
MGAHNQQIPADFADVLLRMRAYRDPRLNATLAEARQAGWTLAAIGRAVRLSDSTVYWRSQHVRPDAGPMDVPKPPARSTRDRPAPRPRLSEQEAILLRDLTQKSRGLRRGTPSDDPRRAAGAELAALMFDHYKRRVSVGDIARAAGVNRQAVRSRLARYGYIAPAPSQARECHVA